MLASIACVKRAWRSFGRLSGSQPSPWFWAWSWDPLKFMRRHPPHHLSPAQANYPAGQDHEARLNRLSLQKASRYLNLVATSAVRRTADIWSTIACEQSSHWSVRRLSLTVGTLRFLVAS